MTREELRDYVEEQRSLNNIPYHVYSELIDGIDTLEQEPILDKIRAEIEQNIGDNPYKNDGIYCSLHVIDKYKAESEPQESKNEENLKPCPFCGSVNVEVYNKYGSAEYVKCNKCGVRTAADEREKVVKLWNTRCSQESDGRE